VSGPLLSETTAVAPPSSINVRIRVETLGEFSHIRHESFLHIGDDITTAYRSVMPPNHPTFFRSTRRAVNEPVGCLEPKKR